MYVYTKAKVDKMKEVRRYAGGSLSPDDGTIMIADLGETNKITRVSHPQNSAN